MDLNSITPKTFLGKTCEAVGCIIIIGMWICSIYYYSRLPDMISIHSNIQGVTDGYGGKIFVFLYPAIATLFYVGMTLATKKNLRCMKLYLTIVFAIVFAEVIVRSL